MIERHQGRFYQPKLKQRLRRTFSGQQSYIILLVSELLGQFAHGRAYIFQGTHGNEVAEPVVSGGDALGIAQPEDAVPFYDVFFGRIIESAAVTEMQWVDWMARVMIAITRFFTEPLRMITFPDEPTVILSIQL